MQKDTHEPPPTPDELLAQLEKLRELGGGATTEDILEVIHNMREERSQIQLRQFGSR